MAAKPPLRIARPAQNAAASDDALMSRVSLGSAESFAALVERHQGAVRRFCAVTAEDDEAARDLAQETFLEVWRARTVYRPEGRFKALLFTIARNKCRSFSRRRRVARLFGLSPPVEATIDLPIEREEEQRLVQAALQHLPEHFRTPLLLRFIEEMPYEEIAKVIGRTESTARSRVFYGLKQLALWLPEEMVR